MAPGYMNSVSALFPVGTRKQTIPSLRSPELSAQQTIRVRLGVLASHPIQYQAPLFRALAARPEIDLEVLFCSKWGLDAYLDPEFAVRFSWDVPLTEGYRWRILSNIRPRGNPAS